MMLLNLPYNGFLTGVRQALDGHAGLVLPFCPSPQASAVIFLLGQSRDGEPLVIFNKRSVHVRQPGDLCFPGGSISPRLDAAIAKLLCLPVIPGFRRTSADRDVALLLATGLREAFEEMRLNPLKLSYLGLLPTQRLVMFQRDIHPLVCVLRGWQRFFPNWEVEKVMSVPLRNLLDPVGYARYHLEMVARHGSTPPSAPLQTLCFCIGRGQARELLWGATFRIVLAFLDIVFGFKPPDLATLPVVYGRLDETYLGRPSNSALTGRQR